jgi:energy-coupling factor transporter transmembrane protein EcfT
MWNVLHQSPMFENLSTDDFGAVMSLLQIETLSNGTQIINQQGDNPNLYVIRRGKAAARVARPGGVDEVIEYFKPGDLINVTSFLTGKINDYGVEAVDDLEVWVIPGADFRALKADLESIEQKLNYPDDAKAYLQTSKVFEDQRPGERVLWQAKKHWGIFVTNGWLAWLLFIALAVTTIVGWRVPLLGIFLLSIPGTILWVGTLIVAVSIALWQFIDWQNDYYVVTDQRVIHRERVLLVHDQQDECPVAKVNNVNVMRENWLSSALDVGDVIIETQGQSSNVEFYWVGRPDAAAKAIMGQTNQARVVNHAAERAKIRATIRNQMSLGGEYRPRTESGYTPKAKTAGAKKPLQERIKATASRIRYTIIPPMRTVDGNDVIYHKHWLHLFKTAGMSMLALLAFLSALIALPVLSVELAQVAFRSLLIIPIIVLGLALIGWLAWQYEDWRNDIYILKRDRLVDIDRTPFGLSGIRQKNASMSSVQNVTYTTNGFIDNFFNMGDVSIKTGGQDGELVFDRVWNPRRVQRDIVDRLETFQNAQREAAAEARRREMAEWIGIYDELAQIHERKKRAT